MKCLVCHATSAQGDRCPQCGAPALDPKDTQAILEARKEFMERATAYNPKSRVSLWDKWRPWVGFVLGFLIFMFWLRACSTMGWRIF